MGECLALQLRTFVTGTEIQGTSAGVQHSGESHDFEGTSKLMQILSHQESHGRAVLVNCSLLSANQLK